MFGGVGAGAGAGITDISRNEVEIKGGNVSSQVGGGWSTDDVPGSFNNANVHNNKVTISGGTITAAVYGGVSRQSGNVYGNEVIIQNVVAITGQINGGEAMDATGTGDATGNKVNIDASSGYITGNITGGKAGGTGESVENGVTLSGTLTINGDIRGGHTEKSGDASYNQVEISGNITQGSGSVYGGHSTDGDAKGNTVTLGGNFIGTAIYGGYVNHWGTGTRTVSDNAVTINGGTYTDIYGGFINLWDGTATGNEVNISDGTYTGEVVGGRVANGTATGNEVNISGGDFSGSSIYGGKIASTGDATGNTVTLSGTPTLGTATLYGGDSGSGDVFTGNTLNKNSVVSVGTAQNFETVNFGYSGDANIGTLDTTPRGAPGTLVKMNTNANNVVFNGNIIDNGTNAGGIVKLGTGTLTLTGTNTYTGDTTVSAGTLSIDDDNKIGGGTNTLAGGTLQLTGSTYSKDWVLNEESNAIETNVMGGTSFGGVLSGTGGFAKTGTGTLELSGANTYTGLTEVRDGTLALSSSGAISDRLVLHDGTYFITGSVTNPFYDGSSAQANLAQLTVLGAATYVGDLNMASGGTMSFYVPASVVSSGTPLLTVNGGTAANINNAAVNIGVDGSAAPLQVGNQITLIDATVSLAGVTPGTVGGMQGSTLQHEFGLATESGGQKLVATVEKTGVTEAAKNISEGYLSGQALLAQGADFLLSKGFAAARTALAGSAGRPEVFAALGGGRLHHQTGSSVAVKGYTLVTGLAAGKKLDAGELTAAAFIEYGDGDYDSYNSVSGGKVKGKGDTGYRGLGVLAHYRLASGLAFEASARAGRVETDYRSNDLRDASGVRARYDAKSTYTSAHIGVGKSWTLNAANQLETYAKGIWTRQASDSARLSTGERLEFDATDSKRLRIDEARRFLSPILPVFLGAKCNPTFILGQK